MDRREFVRGMCLGGLATFAAPMVTFAQVPGRGKLVFVLLRGGFDGLAALVPVGDPAYSSVRGAMAYAPGALVPLGDDFALAPGLAPMRTLWDAGELVPVHAMAIPYRTRSHFDGQAILETGLDRPVGASDGWLNRLLQVMGGKRSGIAVAAGMPRSMEGAYPVLSWSPARLGVADDDYVERLHVLYERDPRLHDPFEAALQIKSLEAEEGGMAGGDGRREGAGAPRGGGGRAASILEAAAGFLREPDGPNVAALEFSGWDTHANQGMKDGPLDRLLGQLATGLVDFRQALGPAWADTTVVVMTEFGRTARPNGTGGTDHGTAGAGFVVGPKVAGGKVLSDWPGLGQRQLYQGRDVRPTLDTRAVLKAVVEAAFELTPAQAGRVFPGSDAVTGVAALMK
jgi:uncharacterized protein (DUF1501 family)